MRHDDPASSSSPLSTTEPDHPARVQPWVWWCGLAVLTATTSLALAFLVTAWLVVPYLALMAWLLAPEHGPRDPARAVAGAGDLADLGGERSLDPSEAEVALRPLSEAGDAGGLSFAASSVQDATSGSASVAVKAKRGRGRPRKSKAGTAQAAVVAPPTEATWIRVGPGKFVRVEGPVANAPEEVDPATGTTTPAPVEDEPSNTAPPTSSVEAAEEELAPPVLVPDDAPEGADRPTAADAPVEAGDELFQDAVDPDAVADADANADADADGSPDVEDEALPGPDALVEAEAVDAPAVDPHDPEPHHDDPTTLVDEDAEAWEEAPALAEAEAHAEAEAKGGASIADDGAGPAAAAAERPAEPAEEPAELEIGPVETPGDQGIALDAPGLDGSADDGSARPEAAEPDDPQATAVAAAAPSRSTFEADAPFVSWRGAWPRARLAVRGPAPAGEKSRARVARTGRNVGNIPGFRRRSKRSAGRYRLVCRTFPPRSPPRARPAIARTRSEGAAAARPRPAPPAPSLGPVPSDRDLSALSPPHASRPPLSLFFTPRVVPQRPPR